MERGQTPLSLPEETAILKTFIEQVGEGVVFLGTDYKVKMYNQCFARQFSLLQPGFFGMGIDQVLPDWSPELRGICEWVQESGETFKNESMKIVPLFDDGRTFLGWLFLFPGTLTFGPDEYSSTACQPRTSKEEIQESSGKIQIEQLLSEAVLNNSPVGIAIFDSASLRLKWANGVYREAVEEPDLDVDLRGCLLTDLIPGAAGNGLVSACQRVATTGVSFFAPEFRVDGWKRGVSYWRLTIVRLAMDRQEAPALLFIVVDLTEQIKNRKQQEELANIAENSLAQLEAVVNSLTEGIVITDPHHQVVFMNPAGLRIVGFNSIDEALRPLEEYYRRFRFRTLSGQVLTPEECPFTRAQRGETYFDLELLIDDLEQSRSWIGNFSGTPVRNRKGELILGVVVVHDITNAKRTEQEREKLLASERRARTEAERQAMQKQVLLDNIREGVLVISPGGRLLVENKVALEIIGLQSRPETLEELFSRISLFRKDGTALTYEELPTTRLFAGNYFTDEEYRLLKANGDERRLLLSVNAVKGREGRVFMILITLRDVTELRRLEQMKEDYLHMVSHDLRSPLAVILSHAQLLGLIARDDARIANSAQAIATSSLRMNNMISDLVDSTRIESGQLILKTTLINLDWFIRDFLVRMRGVMEVDRIRIADHQDLPPVAVDPDRLERIFVNLLSNALKYSAKEKKVEIGFRVTPDRMVVAVKDEGKGIAPADLPHVFDRYFRVRSRGEEGLGLGLYIVRSLVEAHGGQVWAESKFGHGSTFFFTLPLADK